MGENKAQVGFRERALKCTGILQDITRRRQAEEEQERLRGQLAHVSRAAVMGELTAALAHEINQPLAAILANAQAALHLIRDPKPDIGEVAEILGDIIDDDKRAREVISRVRFPARRSSNGARISTSGRDLSEGEELVHLQGISVRTELAEGLLPVMGDRMTGSSSSRW